MSRKRMREKRGEECTGAPAPRARNPMKERGRVQGESDDLSNHNKMKERDVLRRPSLRRGEVCCRGGGKDMAEEQERSLTEEEQTFTSLLNRLLRSRMTPNLLPSTRRRKPRGPWLESQLRERGPLGRVGGQIKGGKDPPLAEGKMIYCMTEPREGDPRCKTREMVQRLTTNDFQQGLQKGSWAE